MKANVDGRFSPLNFVDIVGFPNDVPTIDIWGYFLPRFRQKDEDNPTLHMIDFHQCMHQLGISHEDFLMRMFMYSLEGDVRECY
jgi:hypothetical protein